MKSLMNVKQCAPSNPACFPADSQESELQMSRMLGSELWTDGLICAYEFVPGRKQKVKFGSKFGQGDESLEGIFDGHVTLNSGQVVDVGPLFSQTIGGNAEESLIDSADKTLCLKSSVNSGAIEVTGGATSQVRELDSGATPLEPVRTYGRGLSVAARTLSEGRLRRKMRESHWTPIGWTRLSELVQLVEVTAESLSQPMGFINGVEEGDPVSAADAATPYWEPPAGPTWWCHVAAGHPFISSWLAKAQWLHPAVSAALRDESRLISDRMKYLYYEVPVRVAGGLLFELLGQSAGDPHGNEEDVPIVLRSWQAENFLVTAIHVKGNVSNLNVLGIMEVQDLIRAGGAEAPESAHEVVAHLAKRLARWDNRLFRKHIFGAADEVELMFVNRRGNEDLALLSTILYEEIRRLSTQVIRVKWSLHAREEIVFELSEHLRGKCTQEILNNIRRSTRDMIGEQEAVRDRLFTVQDAMQNTVRAGLQDKSVQVTHNLTVFGGCGLILSIITGLFGINVDGIPGGKNTPYAFLLFAGCLLFLGAVLIGLGMMYWGFGKPITKDQLAARKLDLQDLVKTFQRAAENHEKLRKVNSSSLVAGQTGGSGSNLNDYDYVLIA